MIPRWYNHCNSDIKFLLFCITMRASRVASSWSVICHKDQVLKVSILCQVVPKMTSFIWIWRKWKFAHYCEICTNRIKISPLVYLGSSHQSSPWLKWSRRSWRWKSGRGNRCWARALLLLQVLGVCAPSSENFLPELHRRVGYLPIQSSSRAGSCSSGAIEHLQ